MSADDLTAHSASLTAALALIDQQVPRFPCRADKSPATPHGFKDAATGGYVIWWPAAGLPVLSDRRAARWPEWLRVRLSSSPRLMSRRIRVPDDHAVMRLGRLVARADASERNNLTYWAACRAGEMVASGLLKADVAAALIAEAAMRAGLPNSKAERTA